MEGEIKITRGTKSLSEVCLNTTRTLTERLGSHTNAFLLSAKGCGFSFSDFERNKDRALFYERKRKFIFLLSAKGSRFSFGRQKKQKRQGEFSEFPPAPQNSSHPRKRQASEREKPTPLSKGAMGNRWQADEYGYKRTSKDKAEKINRVCFFAIKADGKECRPLFANFNFSSLSRARKFQRAVPAKFFDAIP